MKSKYVTNTYKTADAYKKILINAQDAAVTVEQSDDHDTKIVFYEKKRRPYEFSIKDDTLVIQSTKKRWYHFLRIGIDHSEIKLCVPNFELEAISVRANTGHVDMRSIACLGTIDIRINTGKTSLENVTCGALDSKGNTGSVSLEKVVAEKSIFIKHNTGKVLLNDSTAPEIFVKTNTGKVSGKLPSNTVFTVRTNTGKIELPKAPIGEAIGGRCDIKTNTGSIKFE